MDITGMIKTVAGLIQPPKERFVDIGDDAPQVVVVKDAQGAEHLEFPSSAYEWWEKRAKRLADAPERREGVARHTEESSFVEHVNRQKGANTTIWADLGKVTFEAIFDYNPVGGDPKKAGWCKHRSIYVCPKDDAWLAWNAIGRSFITQEQFADFIEEHLDDIASGTKEQDYPKAAEVLELARDLKVHTKGTFERKLDPRTGEASLVCKQENEYSSTSIPRAFLVYVPIFVGGSAYEIEARVRMKVREGQAFFSVVLHQANERERLAFCDIRDRVRQACSVSVFSGKAEVPSDP